jgi:hypothetical protein
MTEEEKQKYDEERYQEKIKETARSLRENRKKAGLCSTCGKDKQGEITLQCAACKDRTREYSRKRIEEKREEGLEKEYRDLLNNRRKQSVGKLKSEVFGVYGNKCACCGEEDKRFLTIDHVNNDGAEHRRILGKKSETLMSWAKKQGFPNSLQLLCWNCNLGKAIYGKCPHVLTEEETENEVAVDAD